MAFMSALAHNVMCVDVKIEKKRCIAHTIKKRPIAKPDDISLTLASLNVILAYYKLKDDVLDEKKGTCYGNIGKDDRFLRLYNAPWVCLYFTELYKWSKEKRWIELVVRILRYYYGVGGAKFYPNGIRFYTVYQEIVKAGDTVLFENDLPDNYM